MDQIPRYLASIVFWTIFLIVPGFILYRWLIRFTAETRASISYVLGYTLVHRSVIDSYEKQIATLERNLNYYLAHPAWHEKSGQLSLFNETPKTSSQRIKIVLYNYEKDVYEEWSIPSKEYKLYQEGKIKVQRATPPRRNGRPEIQTLWVNENEIRDKDRRLGPDEMYDWHFEGEYTTE
jgi:hypothetical protein